MAITVGAVGAQFAGATSPASPGKPAGLVNGDVILAVFGMDANVTGITLPTGWVECAPRTLANSSQLWAAYKIITNAAGEPSTYSFTVSGTSFHYDSHIIAFSGVDNTTPIDVASNTGGSWSNSTTANCPSITTVTANAMTVGVVCSLTGSITFTSVAWASKWAISGAFVSDAVGTRTQVTAGATGTQAWTAGVKSAGISATIALRPATGAVAAGLPPSSRHTTYPTITSGGIYS